MQITFTATSARELHDQVISFCKEFSISTEPTKQAMLPLTKSSPQGLTAEVPPTPVLQNVSAISPVVEGASEAEKRPRGRPKKEVPVQDLTSEETPAPAGSALSKQVVTESLTAVNSKYGLSIARGVLLKFGTDRLSSLPAEKYLDFNQLCADILASPSASVAQSLLA